MKQQRKPNPRTTMDRVSDLGLWLIVGSAVADNFKSRSDVWHTAAVVLQWIGAACIVAWIIWLFAQRKELERLVFYQSSAIAFCATVAFGLVWALLEDAHIAHRLPASTYVLIPLLSWFGAMLILRWRAR